MSDEQVLLCNHPKMVAARAIVESFNRARSPAKHIKWDDIVSKLEDLGVSVASADDDLAQLSWEDLETRVGLPFVLAKRLASAEMFRKRVATSSIGFKLITEMRATAMSADDLLTNYDPEGERNPAVTRRLKELAGDACFIRIKDDGSVDVLASVAYLREVRRGFTNREWVRDRDSNLMVKLYKAGERPVEFSDENPLYPGHVLKDGEVCSLTDRSWKNVPRRARQILFLALTKGKGLKVCDVGAIHDILDRFEGKEVDAVLDLCVQRYPEAAVCLQEMEEQGQVPPLRIKISGGSSIILPGVNDPFFGKGPHRVS